MIEQQKLTELRTAIRVLNVTGFLVWVWSWYI